MNGQDRNVEIESPPRLWINLIVASATRDHYLVRVEQGHFSCHRLAWPHAHAVGDVASNIEAAVQLALGIRVRFVDLAAVLMPEVYVIVQLVAASSVAVPGSRIVSVAELVELQADRSFIRMLESASDRLFADSFAERIGPAVSRAMEKSVAYIVDGFTVEDGRAGWSEDLAKQTVGVLSSAQAILTLCNCAISGPYVELAAKCLEAAQNDDGGWRIRHALAGEPSATSITESTCYCLLALAAAGRSVDGMSVTQGIGWLLSTQRPNGGWGASKHVDHSQVVSTALAVRTLARLGFRQTASRGAEWLRTIQHENGGWPFAQPDHSTNRPSVAPTAHAIISMLAVGIPATDAAVVKGGQYLRVEFVDEPGEAPWRSSTWKTQVDQHARMNFHHYATPWALIALLAMGTELGDPLVQKGLTRLLVQQESDGSWLDPTFAHQPSLWGVHDATTALKAVVALAEANLGVIAMSSRNARTVAMLESIVTGLLATSVS